jgi:hypothetical protein
MHRPAFNGLFACALGLLGCTSETTAETPQETPRETFTFETPPFDVPTGDSFECFYLDVFTDRELAVDSATAVQAVGGHHVTIYYIDKPHEVTHYPCKDEEMASWHQIVAASSGGEPVIDLPHGIAFKVPPDKQLVAQAHYINATGSVMSGVVDSISINVVKPEDVVEYANLWALYDPTFELGPQAPGESISTCTLKKDMNVISLLGHEHELGTNYRLERIDAAGVVQEVMYETEWTPAYTSHPPVTRFTLEEPLFLPAGTRFRQTCNWNNTTNEVVKFPREMCIGVMYYFPDDDMQLCIGVHGE